MQTADQIREFVRIHYVDRARAARASEVEVHAGAVHREMSMVNRMPAICSALDAARFRDECGLTLVHRRGPRQSSSVIWRFTLKPTLRAATERLAVSPRGDEARENLENDRSRLELMRWRIVEAVRALEIGHPCHSALGERLRRLMEARRIPETTGRLMFVVLGLRNRVVYRQRGLDDLDRRQLEEVWRAIERWMCGRDQAVA